WFAQSNADMRAQHSLYLAVLQKGVPSPLLKESDEEKGTEEKSAEQGKGKAAAETKIENVKIEFDGLDQRILAIPAAAGNLKSLQVGSTGQIYYLSMPAAPPPSMMEAAGSLHSQ